jgi:hypothetical protein
VTNGTTLLEPSLVSPHHTNAQHPSVYDSLLAQLEAQTHPCLRRSTHPAPPKRRIDGSLLVLL